MGKLSKVTHQILVCKHRTCVKQGADDSLQQLKTALRHRNLQHEVIVTKVDCLDQCGRGPVMVVHPDGTWYGSVDERAARGLVEKGIIKGKQVKRAKLLHQMGSSE